MNWKLMQRYLGILRKVALRRANSARPAGRTNSDQPSSGHTDDNVFADAAVERPQIWAGMRLSAIADGNCSDKVYVWRQRVLLKRGAIMHAAMGANAENCSLAMLDAAGVVLSWYEPDRDTDSSVQRIVGRHVAQFYVPEDIKNKQPFRDLNAATLEGKSTREGWQRRPDGSAFWGTAVTAALHLGDGRLQGFSYVMRWSEGPQEQVPLAQSVLRKSAHWLRVRTPRVFPHRDRVAISRRRTPFRLARRPHISTRFSPAIGA